MKIKNILIATIFASLLISCKKGTKKFQKIDAWEKIQRAVKDENVQYLLNISNDTLQCLECKNGKEWISKQVFYKEHFDQMKLGGNNRYGFFIENIKNEDSRFDERIRIGYKKEHKGNKYDIFYTILKSKDTIQFLGVFSVP